MEAIVIYPDPCPETGRRLVTVAKWGKRPDDLIDEYAYWRDPEKGQEKWRLVEGVTLHAQSRLYDVLFSVRSCPPHRTTLGEHPIYISSQNYEALTCCDFSKSF